MVLYQDDANTSGRSEQDDTPARVTREEVDLAAKRLRWYRALALFLALVLGAFVWIEGSAWLASVQNPRGAPRAIAPRTPLSSGELETIQLFETTSPSVVHITNVGVRRDFFTLNLHAIPQGTGSGFIWDRDGYVVTNAHVIQGAQQLHVKLADQSIWPAKFVGWEPDKDLAVLKIAAAVSL